MGAKLSKRSVDISNPPKKGDIENGAVAKTEEKLEKISEGETTTAKVNANGSTTTTSTVTADQQETVVASPAEAGDAPSTKPEEPIEEPAEKLADVTATSVEEESKELTSPASPSETNEEGASDKKKKPKKKWSFRSFSFSKKDKVKPASKEEKQETVPEDNENTQSEQATIEEVTSAPAVQSEEPPPLPTSPPPTPADEVEKEETPTISEGDVDASGGGEGLAEPIEDAELEESTAIVAEERATTPAPVETPLTNGVAEQNGGFKEQNGKFTEDDELISPVEENPTLDSEIDKITLKLKTASDITEHIAQNGVEETEPIELNGVKENGVSLEKAVEN